MILHKVNAALYENTIKEHAVPSFREYVSENPSTPIAISNLLGS